MLGGKYEIWDVSQIERCFIYKTDATNFSRFLLRMEDMILGDAC